MACLSWLRARSTVRRDSHMRPHSPIALQNSPLESPTSTCLAPFELDSHAKVSHASSKDTIDRHLYIMTQKKKEWASLPLQRKAEILLEVRQRIVANLLLLGKEGSAVRGLDASLDISMEMLTYATVIGNYITKLAGTLKSIAQGHDRLPLTTHKLDNGVSVAKIWPVSFVDSMDAVLPSVEASVYLYSDADTGFCKSALDNPEGGICAILGAGNHGFLAVKDVLVAMFEHNQVVLLKPHPMQAKWQALADDALAPLAQLGYYASVDCASFDDVQHLLHHPLVDAAHMTGGKATHDAIVWGPTKEEQARRKAENDPLLQVPMSCELGGVSPAIIVGGEWTTSQMKSQAKDIAMGFTNNNSCNCNAIKVLILPGDWPLADAFVAKVKKVLSHCPLVPAVYPGIQARYNAWHDKYPDAEVIDSKKHSSCKESTTVLPYLVQTFDTVPENPLAEYAFQVEAFSPVLSIVKLPTRGTKEFLEAATAFANDNLLGNLSATLVVSPKEEKAHKEEVQKALQDLQFGMIGVNTWTGTHFMLGVTSWGPYNDASNPATSKEPGSGIGIAGNPSLFNGIQKTVFRAPMEGFAVPVPFHMKPVPRVAVLVVSGYALDRLRGVWRALFRMRSK